MNKAITITIEGQAGSGKSVVAHLIRQVLSLHGLTVTLIDDNGAGMIDERPGLIDLQLFERLDTVVKNKAPITIQTAQERRFGKPANTGHLTVVNENWKLTAWHTRIDIASYRMEDGREVFVAGGTVLDTIMPPATTVASLASMSVNVAKTVLKDNYGVEL